MSTVTFTNAMNITTAAIVAVGCIGHVISIMVFARKTFRNNSISTYCISLAIVECLSLVRLAANVSLLAYNVNITDINDLICKWLNFLVILLYSIQPWIMVAFAIDKLLSMRTKSIAILKKKWFQLALVAAIVLVNASMYIYHPILIRRREVAPGRFVCDPSTIGFFSAFMIQIIVETSIIPFAIMIFTSILTIWLLIKSRNSVQRTGHVSKDRKSRDTKYAISSIAFNFSFIVLKLPFSVFYLLNAFYSYYDPYFFSLANFFFYLYSSLGFFLHLATNSLFRRELLVLFRLAKKSDISTTSNTGSTIKRLNKVTPS